MLPPLTDPRTRPSDWRRRDVWLGLLFVAIGALVIAYAIAAYRNDMPIFLWGSAALFGPLLTALGANAIVRSLLARK
jgi:hypothetical protein